MKEERRDRLDQIFTSYERGMAEKSAREPENQRKRRAFFEEFNGLVDRVKRALSGTEEALVAKGCETYVFCEHQDPPPPRVAGERNCVGIILEIYTPQKKGIGRRHWTTVPHVGVTADEDFNTVTLRKGAGDRKIRPGRLSDTVRLSISDVTPDLIEQAVVDVLAEVMIPE